MDTATSDIRAVEFTSSREGDSPVLPDLRGQITENERIGTGPQRDLRASCHLARAFWKRWTQYHARSRIAAKMRCLEPFGERIAARAPDRQTAETHIRIAIMNRVSALGTAEIFRVA